MKNIKVLVLGALFVGAFFLGKSAVTSNAIYACGAGTVQVGGQCDVNAADCSHICASGLTCVPQNVNSQGNGKCQTSTPPPEIVNGACGAELNTCTTGTLSDTADSNTQYLWQCVGSNGGTTADCSLDKSTPPVDVCKNLAGDQTTLPSGMQVNSDGICSCLSGYHQVDNPDYVGEDHQQSFTCEPDITSTPTPPPGNPGGPGDGLSDGRSDGRSSCPECTKAPQGQVLGATTDFAGTGVFEDTLMNVVGMLGGLSTAAGIFLKKRIK